MSPPCSSCMSNSRKRPCAPMFKISGKLDASTIVRFPLRVVESAFLLASLRRLARPSDGPPLSPIRSLAYFLPVIDELLAHPSPDNYLEYLRLKLRRLAEAKGRLGR